MGWGYDLNGVAFGLLYIGNTTGTLQFPGSLDLISRSENGPDITTIDIALDYVRGLESSYLTSMANTIHPMNKDGRRVGDPPFICNSTCVDNSIFLADQD